VPTDLHAEQNPEAEQLSLEYERGNSKRGAGTEKCDDCVKGETSEE